MLASSLVRSLAQSLAYSYKIVLIANDKLFGVRALPITPHCELLKDVKLMKNCGMSNSNITEHSHQLEEHKLISIAIRKLFASETY